MSKVIIFIVFLSTLHLHAQNVGIGTDTPVEKLDVSGSIRTTGEIKPNGVAGQANQVLTSNGNGTMSWSAMFHNNEEETTGNGAWGDCSLNNITGYQPVADEDGGQDQNFASCVAISGNYAVIGIESFNEGALISCGSAVVMKRNVSTGIWEFHSRLFHPEPASYDRFGSSAAISEDFIIIGTKFDDIAGIQDIGSASIFKRNPNTDVWEFMTNIYNSNPEADNNFGTSVAISAEYAIVGAPRDTENGINTTGSATIFKYNSMTNTWQFQGKLINNSASPLDGFGSSVSLSGDYIVIGSPFDDEGGFFDNGSASIFKRNSNTNVWDFQVKLIGVSGLSHLENFGSSVSISGDYVVVGSENDNFSGLTSAGSATIFKRNPVTGVWGAQKTLTKVNPENYDFYGKSVTISGDYVIISSPFADVNGIENAGTVFIYKRFGTIWQLVQNFSNPNFSSFELFGNSVVLDGVTKRFLIGAKNSNGNTGMAFFGKIK
ncbi:MAG: FG-GAP repeat protein [Saprospiraceae bacterium]|nr:FG-GAP repeat protein [Saprospiraceae bacterium]